VYAVDTFGRRNRNNWTHVLHVYSKVIKGLKPKNTCINGYNNVKHGLHTNHIINNFKEFV